MGSPERVVAALPEKEHPEKAFGWAARDTSGLLSPFHFSRRSNGDEDVTMKILYCGVCHSDLHSIKNEWGNTIYPIVPGHEIVGVVSVVGDKVKKFKVGDTVGVGCMVGTCRSCDNCKQDFENYCPKMVLTYNSVNIDGTMTYGGYSDQLVVNQHFVVRFPENLPLDKAAPLLCAGITVYSPMKYFGLNQPGKHLGIVGLGGLGHVAVKFGKAFGMKVTVISSSPGKKKEAVERLGADAFLVSSDNDQMTAAMGTMDGILDTVSAVHPLMPLLSLLKTHGKMIMLGVPQKPLELPVFGLILGGKTVAGSSIGGKTVAAMGTMDGILNTVSAVHPLMPLLSLLKTHGKMIMLGAPQKPLELPIFGLIPGGKTVAGSGMGGMKDTQEMIDFAGKHNITADVEVISMDYVNQAMERLAKNDVRYRFVIDVGNTLATPTA